MTEKGKKMAKYIDRNQLIDWLKTEIKFKDLSDGLGICLVIMKEDFDRAIKHMPDSIIKDVEPVRHGHWKRYGRNLGECSNCGEIVNIRYNYCPNCGFEMYDE